MLFIAFLAIKIVSITLSETGRRSLSFFGEVIGITSTILMFSVLVMNKIKTGINYEINLNLLIYFKKICYLCQSLKVSAGDNSED